MTTDQELANLSMEQRPHVVILGAGASRAAFTTGDATGRPVPVMNDLIRLTGLGQLLREAGIDGYDRNFEELHAELRASEAHYATADMAEHHIREYFAAMRLPDSPCLYDHLLLSLRAKDVIATFNWDPFLFDAYWRNIHIGELPRVLFLHGCVRVGLCPNCHRDGCLGQPCEECGKLLEQVPLVFPVKDKDYSDEAFVARQWHDLRTALEDAFILTVFGYAAPVSDQAAISLMNEAWWNGRRRQLEQIELINTAPRDELLQSWAAFFTRHHYEVRNDFYQSWCARYPRRSCEACWDQFMEMHVRRENTIPRIADFVELVQWLRQLLDVERAARVPNRG